MRHNKKFATLVAVMGMIVVLTGCAGQNSRVATEEVIITKKDTVLQKVQDVLSYSSSLEYKEEVKNDTCMSSLAFDQTSKVIGVNEDGEQKFSATLAPEAEASVLLTERMIEVEEFSAPSCEAGKTSKEDDVDSEKNRKSSSLKASDKFSDGQSANITASSMWQWVEDEMSSIDCAHVEIISVSFKNAELVETESENMMKVVLHYVATFKANGQEEEVNVALAPFYFQIKKVEESKPEINVSGEPYLFADTIMSVKDGVMKCKMVVYQVTPNTLQPNDTVKVAQRTLTVAKVGAPGDETLHVFQKETTANTHDVSEVVESEGSNGAFSWIERKQTHHFRADWNTNGLEGVGHTDDLVVTGVTMKYSDGMSEFSYDFNVELKVVQNEVVNENSSVEGYLGTRILTVAGYCNGEKFVEYTGRTTLVQHQ
jgi:hypothetical protein